MNSNTKYMIPVLIVVFALIFTIEPVFAQTSITEIENNPIAQDILKKIEQAKKMIKELEEKEYEENQARENLEKMRQISMQNLEQDLAEWQRVLEQYTSKNAFENFVNKKPDYVQGVFWDQFEFMESKVIEGRIAMNHILTNGGTMEDARNAYLQVASTQRIELIEVNSQFNVNHNLADYRVQQVFNSTGQIHQSDAVKENLANMYSDYRMQPSYILVNADDKSIPRDTKCENGDVTVFRITTGTKTCVDEPTANKWISSGVSGLVIEGHTIQNTRVNPATKCNDSYQVVYNLESSQYQCVSEETAKKMIQDSIAKKHTLEEYILNKDKQKETDDIIYEINKEIQKINSEYDLKRDTLQREFDEKIQSEKDEIEKIIQGMINQYKSDSDITKEEVTRVIIEIRDEFEKTQEKMLVNKSNALNRLETDQKRALQTIVNGHQNNQKINVDWSNLYKVTEGVAIVDLPEQTQQPIEHEITIENNLETFQIDNINIVNSFGMEFDEIRSGQILQVAADITNNDESEKSFVYIIEIKNDSNKIIQPAKSMSGTLNPEQTLNVGLSWIPQESGKFNASILAGTDIESIEKVAAIVINVNQNGDISDENYCKNGHELLFKYSDYSPICATHATATKMIKIGLAFS
ncbi:MAG: hypothetical protein ACW9W4_08105 [Candidatus Nitrosopumilus sp. bin_7KS]